MIAPNFDIMAKGSPRAYSHAAMALSMQDRIGVYVPEDGPAYNRVRSDYMRRTALYNWNEAIRRGIVI